MEQPHGLGKAWLCYINSQAQLQQKIKPHWSCSVLFFLPGCPSQKAALHQSLHYAAVSGDESQKDECENHSLVCAPCRFGWCLGYRVSLWLQHRVHPVRDWNWGFWVGCVLPVMRGCHHVVNTVNCVSSTAQMEKMTGAGYSIINLNTLQKYSVW